MATWNDWFVFAKESNFDLGKYLKIDQPNDVIRLYSSGLPVFDYIKFSLCEINSGEVKEFIKKHGSVWARAASVKVGKRKSRLSMGSFDELKSFLNALPFRSDDTVVQLYQMKENRFGGNVLVSEDETRIEIAYGLQDIVGKSTDSFFHGKINFLGRLEFNEVSVPENVFQTCKKVLSYLELSRGEYVRGYFEFAVSQDFEIFFMDYKTSFKDSLI